MDHKLSNFKITPIVKKSPQDNPSFHLSFIWNEMFSFVGIKIQKEEEDVRRGLYRISYPSDKFCGDLISIFAPENGNSFRTSFEAEFIRQFEATRQSR